MQIAVIVDLGQKVDQHDRGKFTAKDICVSPSHWSNSPLAPRTRSIRPRRRPKQGQASSVTNYKSDQVRSSQIKSDQVRSSQIKSAIQQSMHLAPIQSIINWNIGSFCFTAGLWTLNSQILPLLDKALPALSCLGLRKSNVWMLSLQSDRKVKSASFRPGTAPSDKNTP